MQDKPVPTLYYYNSDEPVKIRDCIMLRGWFGQYTVATIVHIPGHRKRGFDIEGCYAFRTNAGRIYVKKCSNAPASHIGKEITLVCRADEDQWKALKPYRRFGEFLLTFSTTVLVIIGCMTIVSTCIALVSLLFKAFFK